MHRLALKHQRTDWCTCLNFKLPKGARWTERKDAEPLAGLYSTCACQTLASVCGKELQRPRVGGNKLWGTQIRVEWIYSTPREQPIKRVDTKIPEVTRENTFFSPPSTPPPLYYVTSAVVSIKNTVVLFSKLMKLLTLVFNHHPSPSLFRSPGMLEGSVSCKGLSLVVDTKGKKDSFINDYKWP